MQKDEDLYRQYLSGDETGLDSLMQRYGNSLTLYINGTCMICMRRKT